MKSHTSFLIPCNGPVHKYRAGASTKQVTSGNVRAESINVCQEHYPGWLEIQEMSEKDMISKELKDEL